MEIAKTSILMTLLLYSVISCSNKSLSHFFDGVPSAVETKQSEGVTEPATPFDSSAQKETRETVVIGGANVYHPDYQQKNCEKCHQVEHGYRLKQRQPELCYQCHKGINQGFKKIHGPVAAGFCSACHEAHKSQFTALLKMPVRDVCQHCHEPGDVARNDAHQKISKTACLDCHHPHGGESVNLLRNSKDG